MSFINYKTTNPVYSPGLATYSPKGDKGNEGMPGTSIYFVNGLLSEESIKSNVSTLISTNMPLINTSEGEFGCIYRTGDVVVDEIGDVYMISLEDEKKIGSNPIGNITTQIRKPFYYTTINGKNGIKIIDTVNYLYFGMMTSGVTEPISVTDKDFAELNKNNYTYIEVVSKTTGECAIFPIE